MATPEPRVWNGILSFPSGDEAVLAEQIRRIFLDHDLAAQLSSRSPAVAAERHDVAKLVDTMVEIFHTVAAVRSKKEMALVC